MNLTILNNIRLKLTLEKYMSLKTLLFSLVAYPCLLTGIIVDSPYFEEILNHVENMAEKKILIAFDIDNTLLRAKYHLGCVSWGEELITQLEQKGISTHEAEQIEDIFWRTVQPHIAVDHVDAQAPRVISKIQENNILALGLTARNPDEATYTINQLDYLGINFSRSHALLPCHSMVMPEIGSLFAGGVIFGSLKNKKADVLFHFLDMHSIYPDCIIFIDDKLRHVQDLEEACKKRNIHYVGIRFSAADEYVRAYNHKIAEFQWAMFPKIITNEQAAIMLGLED
jgi:FMN phosphatase YigB (HAD superfamily)